MQTLRMDLRGPSSICEHQRAVIQFQFCSIKNNKASEHWHCVQETDRTPFIPTPTYQHPRHTAQRS